MQPNIPRNECGTISNPSTRMPLPKCRSEVETLAQHPVRAPWRCGRQSEVRCLLPSLNASFVFAFGEGRVGRPFPISHFLFPTPHFPPPISPLRVKHCTGQTTAHNGTQTPCLTLERLFCIIKPCRHPRSISLLPLPRCTSQAASSSGGRDETSSLFNHQS
jgi:hypothetical protein